MTDVKSPIYPTFVPTDVQMGIADAYFGQCYLATPLGGKNFYQFGDYSNLEPSVRKLSYQQVVDYFENKGYDISYQNLRTAKEHRFLLFKDGKWLREVHIVVKTSKYDGYDSVFRYLITLLKRDATYEKISSLCG